MLLQPVETVNTITPEAFKKEYYEPEKPLVIKNLAKDWPAYHKWTWDYFKAIVGDKRVGIYNNTKSDAYTPVNKADDYTTFGEYIDMIRKDRRNGVFFCSIFLIMLRSSHMILSGPDHLMKGFIKRFPMLFVGGETSVTHLHLILISRILCIRNSWVKKECFFFHMKSSINYTGNRMKC